MCHVTADSCLPSPTQTIADLLEWTETSEAILTDIGLQQANDEADMEDRITQATADSAQAMTAAASSSDEGDAEARAQVEEERIRERVMRVLELRAEAERCEPRVASLHEVRVLPYPDKLEFMGPQGPEIRL